MHTRLVPWILIPLFERLSGRRPWTTLRRLRALQWRSPEELEARALARLRPLLAHAHAHVPYYRELFRRAGLDPADVRTVADLARLPLSGKAELRANFPVGVAADNLPARRRERGHTSGSTGLPFEFYLDRASWADRLASGLLFQEWAGIAPGQVVFRISTLPPPPGGLFSAQRARDIGRRILLGERFVWLAGARVTAAEFLAAVGRLPPASPYAVWGNPSFVPRLAARLLEADARLPTYPRVVVFGAEAHTAADLAVVERAFRSPIVNRYGIREMNFLAQTCPDNPAVLHVNSERVILRVVRDDGRDAAPGESGRVALTDLANRVMPFINYDVGDRARAGGPCRCGRGFPTLLGLDGRTGELIRTPGGKTISPAAMGLGDFLDLPGFREALEHVWEYQVVQTAADAVVLRVVPTSRFTPAFGRWLAERLARYLGPGMAVTVEPVERIAAEASGKRLIIKSELPAPERGADGR